MKAKIYIIKNIINTKVYIGQTTKELAERLRKHIQESSAERSRGRPLYDAMKKYGSANFFIELLEECDFSRADEREQYWIKFYASLGSGGYNATVGGKWYAPYDYDRIADLLKSGLRTREIMEQTGCCKQIVYRVAGLYEIPIHGSKHNKKVCMADVDGRVLHVFESTAIAAKHIKNSLENDTAEATIRKNISRCCNSRSRTMAYGFVWFHAENHSA